MAITARIGPGYAWRMIIIAGVCLVLGAWGVYDYAVKIPTTQMLSDRLDLLEVCAAALQTEQASSQLNPKTEKAAAEVDKEIARILSTELTKAQSQAEAAAAAPGAEKKIVINVDDDGGWLELLATIKTGLLSPRALPLGAESYPQAHTAYVSSQSMIDQIGEIVSPGKYDRITQWAFILCLPFAPYFFYLFLAARREEYRLDDDGTLHLPQGTWKAEEISDIDMSRWMAKSIATVVNTDGTRVKLDDYKYKNLHLIVGAIAHRLHPDDWDAEAKPVKGEAAAVAEQQAS